MLFIGDVHGKKEEYIKLTNTAESTIQVGDMDFSYSHLKVLDPTKHVFIAGNHDNHDIVHECPNYLGRFGVVNLGGLIDAFFVGGAYSIDKHLRVEGKSWWRDEELSYSECGDCLSQYALVQPRIVISHDCPPVISGAVFGIMDKTITRNLLGQMWARWKPEYWIFGHWHRSVRTTIINTNFVGLAELETFEL